MALMAYAARGAKQRLEPFEYEPGQLRRLEVEVRISHCGGSCGSPSDRARMLDFTAHSGVKPVVQRFAMADVNRDLDHIRAGKARFRVVLSA